MNDAIRLENVIKLYPPRIRAINDISMRVLEGERVCICGAPGSGKTTLMRLIAGMEPVSQGNVTVFGTQITALDENELAIFRNHTFGIVQRAPAFISSLSILENTALPLLFRRMPAASRAQMARKQLDSLGITHLIHTKPVQLSPFEARLAAIARALITQPQILLLDNVCVGLSEREALKLSDMLDTLWHSGSHTMLYFTSALDGAISFDKKFSLHYGKLREDDL